MKKTLLKIGLNLVIIAVAYWLYKVIDEPIQEKRFYEKRQEAVVDRMNLVKTIQFAHRENYKKFSDNWEDLVRFAENEDFLLIRTIGDPNDTTIEVIRDTTRISIADSLFDSRNEIRKIPYAPMLDNIPSSLSGKPEIKEVLEMPKEERKLLIDAGQINQRGITVQVFEIRDLIPANRKGNRTHTLGSMSDANYSGNWK